MLKEAEEEESLKLKSRDCERVEHAWLLCGSSCREIIVLWD